MARPSRFGLCRPRCHAPRTTDPCVRRHAAGYFLRFTLYVYLYGSWQVDEWFNDVYATKVDSRGLAKPMPVMDSAPTFDMDAVER